jgi:hypothetical protein
MASYRNRFIIFLMSDLFPKHFYYFLAVIPFMAVHSYINKRYWADSVINNINSVRLFPSNLISVASICFSRILIRVRYVSTVLKSLN